MPQLTNQILLIDNFDSFTWNLAALLRVHGGHVTVRMRDEVDFSAVLRRPPRAVVISPGPGAPSDARPLIDFLPALPKTVPVLGVCLGFQCIAHVLGYPIRRVSPIHGQRLPIRHDGTAIFRGLPDPLYVARYHSLGLTTADVAEGPLRILATSAHADERIVMAFACRDRPWVGVQFHPESFATESGDAMIRNFLETMT